MSPPIQRHPTHDLPRKEAFTDERKVGSLNGRHIRHLHREDEAMFGTLGTCVCFLQTIVVTALLFYATYKEKMPE